MEKVKAIYSEENTVLTLMLADGKGNVLDKEMMQQLLDRIEGIRQQSSLKALVIEGEGKHFSFGASVKEHKKSEAGGMLYIFHSIFLAASDIGIPMIAKISGQCLGGGMEIALSCHMIFADKSARFGQPEINLGVFPPPASLILPLKIGSAKAEEILLTGKIFNAEEGKTLGIVNEICDDKAALDDYTTAWIREHILPKSASTLRYAVRAARAYFNEILRSRLPMLEKVYLHELMETSDANEGIISFLEKRKPVWKNK